MGGAKAVRGGWDGSKRGRGADTSLKVNTDPRNYTGCWSAVFPLTCSRVSLKSAVIFTSLFFKEEGDASCTCSSSKRRLSPLHKLGSLVKSKIEGPSQ